MNLQQHKEAWEDFINWYDTDYWFKMKGKMQRGLWYSLPFEMQLGVYLKYLDEKGILYDMDSEMFCVRKKDDEYKKWHTFSGENCKEKAIEQAFKIRNEQLKP